MGKEYVDFSWLTFNHFLRNNSITRKKFVEITGVSETVLRRAEKNKRIDKKYADMISAHYDLHNVISPEVTEMVTRYSCRAWINNGKVEEIRCRTMEETADRFKLDPKTLYCDGHTIVCCMDADSLKDAIDTFMDLIKEYF